MFLNISALAERKVWLIAEYSTYLLFKLFLWQKRLITRLKIRSNTNNLANDSPPNCLFRSQSLIVNCCEGRISWFADLSLCVGRRLVKGRLSTLIIRHLNTSTDSALNGNLQDETFFSDIKSSEIFGWIFNEEDQMQLIFLHLGSCLIKSFTKCDFFYREG